MLPCCLWTQIPSQQNISQGLFKYSNLAATKLTFKIYNKLILPQTQTLSRFFQFNRIQRLFLWVSINHIKVTVQRSSIKCIIDCPRYLPTQLVPFFYGEWNPSLGFGCNPLLSILYLSKKKKKKILPQSLMWGNEEKISWCGTWTYCIQ